MDYILFSHFQKQTPEKETPFTYSSNGSEYILISRLYQTYMEEEKYLARIIVRNINQPLAKSYLSFTDLTKRNNDIVINHINHRTKTRPYTI